MVTVDVVGSRRIPIGVSHHSSTLFSTASSRLRSAPRPDAPMDDVKSFRGIFGSEDSGQTNDGPLVVEGKLLSGHASSRVGEPGPWTGISGAGQSHGTTGEL